MPGSHVDELAYVSATELADRIRSRDLSPVEAVEAAVTRIEERNPSLNAFIYEGFDEARQRADEAEQALMDGADVGPLHGVPTAIKDLFDFKPGWPSTFGGIRALEDFIADFYCPYAERMEQAGAIILGKTNSPTMGFRGTCDNFLFGPSRNPFDTSKNTGGSSGGSAAAVADGLLPVAEGTDGGGSIRIPASWCGVYGFQPSFGRIPVVIRPNAFGGTIPFVYEGPLTRTVADGALALTALNGHGPADPFALPGDEDFRGAVQRDIAGMRVAYSPDLGGFPVAAPVAAAVADAVTAFEDAGAQVAEVEIDLPHDHRELSDLWCRLIMVINHGSLESMKAQGLDLLGDHREDFPPQYLEWVERAYEQDLTDLHRDQCMRAQVYDALEGVFADHDLLVTPTLAALPVDNADDGNTLGPSEIDGVEVNPIIGWCLTYFTNFSGHPAASIPAGLSPDGLPIGMQLIGRRYADADVLAASAAFEQRRPWRDTYVACADRPLRR